MSIAAYENRKTPDPLAGVTPPEGRFYKMVVMSRSRVRAYYGAVGKHTSMLFERVRGRWLVTRE